MIKKKSWQPSDPLKTDNNRDRITSTLGETEGERESLGETEFEAQISSATLYSNMGKRARANSIQNERARANSKTQHVHDQQMFYYYQTIRK